MTTENVVQAPNWLKVEVMFGPSGAMFEFQINLNDKENVVQKITEITDLVKAPLVRQVNELKQENDALKKRALSNEEIQRLARALNTNPSEFRADGRPTQDELLAKKLEVWLKL